jgi:ribosome-associated protein
VRVPEVTIVDDSVRLGQFLKLSGLADGGSDAKMLVEAGEVKVNGEVELRRGRQLHNGDVVTLGGQSFRLRANSAS